MKYTPEQIKQMAREFMNSLNSGDPRAPEVTRRLLHYGWGPYQSIANIKALAK